MYILALESIFTFQIIIVSLVSLIKLFEPPIDQENCPFTRLSVHKIDRHCIQILSFEPFSSTGLWTCIDKDECSRSDWNVCHTDAICTNTNPNYVCDCIDRYDSCSDLNAGEIPGQCCEDRDECQLDAPCATYADCTNGIIDLNAILEQHWVLYACALVTKKPSRWYWGSSDRVLCIIQWFIVQYFPK